MARNGALRDTVEVVFGSPFNREMLEYLHQLLFSICAWRRKLKLCEFVASNEMA